MHNPEFLISKPQQAEYYITSTTIEELGKLQHDNFSTGYYARQQNRLIESLVNSKDLKLIQDDKTEIDKYFNETSLADNIIINTARINKMILVTDDINMRIKCNLIKLKCKPSIKKVKPTQILEPYENITFTDDELDELYKNNKISKKFNNNGYQYLKFKNKVEPIYHTKNEQFLIKQPHKRKLSSMGKLKPKNIEQLFLIHSLFNNDIKLITCIGQQGTGKTLLTLYGQINQVISNNYKKIYLIVNPMHVSNKDRLGFLPGKLDEKMYPYVAQIEDNLNVLYQDNIPQEFNDLFDSQFIEVISIDFLRGRTIHDGFVIVDEAQNYNKHEIKTILTRVQDSSKIVLLGDVEQIDTKTQIDQSGLFLTANLFLNIDYANHIRLINSERGIISRDQSRLL